MLLFCPSAKRVNISRLQKDIYDVCDSAITLSESNFRNDTRSFLCDYLRDQSLRRKEMDGGGALLSSEEVADPYQVRISRHADPLSREPRESTLSSKNPTNTSE